MQFNARPLFLEAALETAIVAVVRGSRHQQIVLALGRLETDSVFSYKGKEEANQKPINIIKVTTTTWQQQQQ